MELKQKELHFFVARIVLPYSKRHRNEPEPVYLFRPFWE